MFLIDFLFLLSDQAMNVLLYIFMFIKSSPLRPLSQSNEFYLLFKGLCVMLVCAIVYAKLRRKIEHNVKEFYPDRRLNINGYYRG